VIDPSHHRTSSPIKMTKALNQDHYTRSWTSAHPRHRIERESYSRPYLTYDRTWKTKIRVQRDERLAKITKGGNSTRSR